MIMNDDLRDMIMRNCTTDELRRKAVEYGMITLRDYGTKYVFEGVTTVDEVARNRPRCITQNSFNRQPKSYDQSFNRQPQAYARIV